MKRHAKPSRARCLHFAACAGLLVLGLTSGGCQRKAPAEALAPPQDSSENESAPEREVLASWYDVPVGSVTKERAGAGELTAANNRLPFGTRVRVTHVANGKSVVVRITDRGNFKPRIKIDLCKEAAQKLDMVGEGIARVRMQILSDGKATEPSPGT